jgi:acetyl esterase/lipase
MRLRQLAVSALLVGGGLLANPALSQQAATPTKTPGPYILPVDYDALYKMEAPPSYEPFAFYGAFLMSVAFQQSPMIADVFEAIPDSVKAISDVLYKEVNGRSLYLDIYRPKGDAKPNPLILVFHGGYWKAGDKADTRFHALRFADMGYTVASVGYRLSGEAAYPANVEDLFDAVRFLTKNADTYGIDPNRIATFGGSAGGHLASMVGLAANTSGYRPASGIDASAFKAVMSIYGINDLTLAIQRMDASTQQYIGAPWDKAGVHYTEASPISHVDADDPPVFLSHGTIDGSVSVLNSDSLAAKLKSVGVPVVYDRVEGWPHIMDFFSPVGERTLWFAHRFLSEHMPSDEMQSVK